MKIGNGGKPLFLSELGTMVYGWRTNNSGPARFESALKDAELMVHALNLGVDGFNRWSFVNRGDLDGQWQKISTWDETNKTLFTGILNSLMHWRKIFSFFLTGD